MDSHAAVKGQGYSWLFPCAPAAQTHRGQVFSLYLKKKKGIKIQIDSYAKICMKKMKYFVSAISQDGCSAMLSQCRLWRQG